MSILAQNFGDQWDFRASVQKRKGSKSNYAKSPKADWVKRNLPTKVCIMCNSDRPRVDFVKVSSKCGSCRAQTAVFVQAKREAAKVQRAEKLPPHCKFCETYDVSELVTRKNPSGTIGFRNICFSCYYDRVTARNKERAEKAQKASSVLPA